MQSTFIVLTLALLIDRFFGDPDWLWKKIPHPAALFGRALDVADRLMNKSGDTPLLKRRNGFLAVTALLFPPLLPGGALIGFLRRRDGRVWRSKRWPPAFSSRRRALRITFQRWLRP